MGASATARSASKTASAATNTRVNFAPKLDTSSACHNQRSGAKYIALCIAQPRKSGSFLTLQWPRMHHAKLARALARHLAAARHVQRADGAQGKDCCDARRPAGCAHASSGTRELPVVRQPLQWPGGCACPEHPCAQLVTCVRDARLQFGVASREGLGDNTETSAKRSSKKSGWPP
jgi:hypothetical protein